MFPVIASKNELSNLISDVERVEMSSTAQLDNEEEEQQQKKEDDENKRDSNLMLNGSKKSRSKSSKKKTTFEMNMFTNVDLDAAQQLLVMPCNCKFNAIKLELISKEIASVYLVVKMDARKRSLRTNEIQLKPIGDDLIHADLNLNYSIIYPYYAAAATSNEDAPNTSEAISKDNSHNLLNFYLQQRKKYKNRTILGYKTIAHGQIDLNSLMNKQIGVHEIPLVVNVTRSRKSSRKTSEQNSESISSSSKRTDRDAKRDSKQRESQQLIGHLTVKSLTCQLLDSTETSVKVSDQQQTLNKLIKNRQVKLLRKELKLLKSKATNGKKLLMKKDFKSVDQGVGQLAIKESGEMVAEGKQLATTTTKKPKFRLSLNKRSNLTFSDSDEIEQQNPKPFKANSVASALVSSVANNTSSIIAQATSSTKKTSASTISAIRRSIINSSNSFASNTANKNAKKLTGKFISFIRKFRNDSDENENDIEDIVFEDELDEHQPSQHHVVVDTECCSSNDHLLTKMDFIKDQINNIIINDYENFNDQDFEEDDDLNTYDLDNIEQVSNQISDDERDDATDHQDVYSIISTPKPKLLPFFTKSQQELNYKHIMEEYQIKDNYLISISNSKLDKSSIDKLSAHLNDKSSSNGSNTKLSNNNDYKKSTKVKYETTINLLTIDNKKSSSSSSSSKQKSKTNLKSSNKQLVVNNSIGAASNEEKLERVLNGFNEKRLSVENEYLFLLIDQSDPLNHVLREHLRAYENVSYFESASNSLSDLKKAISRVLSWLIRNETILINCYCNFSERFQFKVLIIGNDQFVNRYLQAYVDLFKEDNELIYLKYFKHYYVPSHSSFSTNSTRGSLKLASILFSKGTKAAAAAAANKKEIGLYKRLFGDDAWFGMIKKIQHKKSSDTVSFNEIWSKMSRYLCSANSDGESSIVASGEIVHDDFKLEIGQVDLVFNGPKFCKLQLPFLFDIKVSSCDVTNINELNLVDNENSENFIMKKAKQRTKSLVASNSLSDFEKLKRKQHIDALDQSNSGSQAATTTTTKKRDTFISDFPVFLSPQLETFQNLKNQILNINVSETAANGEESALRNEFKLHIEYSHYESLELKSINQQQSSVNSLENQFNNLLPLTSSLTLPNFSNSKLFNSNFKQLNLTKSSSSNSKFVQIYRTSLFSGIQLENDLNAELTSNLSMACLLNKDKQQKQQQKIINRLTSKKLRDDDHFKSQVINGVVKLTCKPSKIVNLVPTGKQQVDPDNLIQFKASVDGIIYDNIKYIQVTSNWQTILNSNEISRHKSNKQLKYLNLVLS